MASIIDRLAPGIRQTIAELGFTALTPIQTQAIPLLLDGRDVIAQSKTGSGKTAAYALPLLGRLHSRRRPQALILCPTRELSAQVARELRKFGRTLPGLQVLVVAGGQPFRPQALALEGGVHVVVGTPGRIIDHLRRRTLDLSALSHLVLDEADRMLDMGFEDDMREILAACPPTRQTALFSATFPAEIAAISRTYQRDAVRVAVEDDAAAAPAIEQYVVEVPHDEKLTALLRLLEEHRPPSYIVFCNLKVRASELATALEQAGVAAAALHGDLEQRDRDAVLAKFRNRSLRALVATDVAARGLDVEAVDAVFNFDLPARAETYVHRIGRTGRAGRTGLAVSLATPREGHKLDAIEELTGNELPRKRLAAGVAPARIPDDSAAAAMATLRVSAGRKAKIRPGDILGALTGEAGGLPADAVGKIEIHDFLAYVAVRRDLAAGAAASLQAGRIKGRKIFVELQP